MYNSLVELDQHHTMWIYVYMHTCAHITITVLIVSPILTASVTQSAGQDMALFVVKFDYDPLKMSPNPNPQHELTLTAGRYVYIYGDMDEVCVYVCVS